MREREEDSAGSSPVAGPLVLVVDDHPTNRALLTHQIQALGFAVECAPDGHEALLLWETGRFALVITDCNMPEVSGYDLARALRYREAELGWPRTPVVACTANAMGREAQTSLEAGMDDHLVKPVELPALLNCLNRWLPTAEPAGLAAAPSDQPATPRAPVAEPAGLAPIERSALAAFSDGDLTVERSILNDFRRVNDGDLTMLRQAVCDSDHAKVRIAAHRIKGASKMVGAMALAEVCEHIHEASSTHDAAAVKRYMPAFEREALRLNAYLDAL